MDRMSKMSHNCAWCWHGHPACTWDGKTRLHLVGVCPPAQAEGDVNDSLPDRLRPQVMGQLRDDLDRWRLR